MATFRLDPPYNLNFLKRLTNFMEIMFAIYIILQFFKDNSEDYVSINRRKNLKKIANKYING